MLEDLQGPKIRLGTLKDNHFDVKKGDEIILDYAVEEHDGSATMPVQYNLADKVKVDEPVYLFDGKVKTTMIRKNLFTTSFLLLQLWWEFFPEREWH